MAHSISSNTRDPSSPETRKVIVDPVVEKLEELVPGRQLATRDGSRFIRTNRLCMCFCNLETGCLCSAKDICDRYGGVDEKIFK